MSYIQNADEIKEEATKRIVEVIGNYVQLKKSGINYMGVCPFHNGRSFNVSPTKGFYKCFGCGKSGSAISFVIDHKRVQYPEALKLLADQLNVIIVYK